MLHGNLIDPDSYMRLVRIRQGLAAGHLVNVVRGDDSGVPLVIEWSRLFDAAIVALAAPLVPLLGWSRALLVAGIATGPLSAGLLGAGLAFAATPLTGGKWLPAAAIIGGLLPGIRNFDAFGIIHYHIAQAAFTAITIGCVLRAGRGDRVMAWAAGIAGGVSIWLMPETMPFVLLGFGGLGYVWLFRPLGGIFARLGAGFAGTLWLALWLDPPHGGMLVAEIDRLSIVYAILGTAVATAGLWLAWLDGTATGRGRAVLGTGGAGLLFALWLSAFPTVALGPFGLLPPSTVHAFFGSMAEVQPVGDFGRATALLGPAAFGLAYVLYRTWRARRDALETGLWLVAATALVLAIGLTARMIIFEQYPAAIAAGLAPVALHEISTRCAGHRRRAGIMRVGLIWLPVLMVYLPAGRANAGSTGLRNDPASCSLLHIAPLMRAEAGEIVLENPSDVPELLYRTRIIGTGSLYQHGVAAYMRSWHAWRAASGPREPEAVRATGARYVLFCPSGADQSSIATGVPQNSLWRTLAAGHVPPWLKPVGRGGGYDLYRIEKATSDGSS